MQPDKRKNSVRMLKVRKNQVRLSIRLLLALSVLLVMAGVEPNPVLQKGHLRRPRQELVDRASPGSQ